MTIHACRIPSACAGHRCSCVRWCRHGWTRVLSTYPCVNQAEQVITGARSAVQSIAPSDPFPDKQWMESAYLAVCDAGGHDWEGVCAIGAAYHYPTTSSPKLFLPKPDMHLTCHHRNALLAIARWHVAPSSLVQRPSPSSPSSGAFTPPWTPSQKFFRTCSTRCRLRCATRCACASTCAAGAQSRRCCATFRPSSTGPSPRTSIGARVFS